ncbi:radical SAM family heme chaperone HemW [Spiroplasma endosymbiont of Labia minor]|uniref:radical SAM family heme chaperone HemW n=1 Tax=Spiroplasma endosymbiont of Labia minor TaxID=3066305 RepID=UPI0030CE8E80
MTKSSSECLITKDQIKNVYVHIPFCEHICFYCDFVKTKVISDKLIDDYLDKLINEWKTKNCDYMLDTIYIGGGTPSVLNVNQINKLMSCFQNNICKDTEITIELNPESTRKDKLIAYKNNGINRISLGVQTFSDDLLKKIGRKHTLETIKSAFYSIKEVGFENISIDLMYNLFDQTKKDIYFDFKMIKKLRPNHISWYSLILKEDSIWGKMQKKLPLNDYNFDLLINKKMAKSNFERYEISNYALDGKKSKHNLCYWTNKLFYGIGVGASGFESLDNELSLTNNVGNVTSYKQKKEILTIDDYYFQILMMGLRLIDGINLNIENDTYFAFKRYEISIQRLISKNLLEIKNNHLKTTELGYINLNDVLIEILE